MEFRFNKAVYRALFPDLLRPLTAEERADLDASVRDRGVQAPVIVDEADGIIDGINRCVAAEAAGFVGIPVRVVRGLGGDEKRALAVELNDCRRHQTPAELEGRRRTRAEKRAAVAAAIVNDPEIAEMSNRAAAEAISTKIGEPVTDKMVGAIRDQLRSFEETSQLASSPAAEAISERVGEPVSYQTVRRMRDALTATPVSFPEMKQVSPSEHGQLIQSDEMYHLPDDRSPGDPPQPDADPDDLPDPDEEAAPPPEDDMPAKAKRPEKTRGKDGKLRPAKRPPAKPAPPPEPAGPRIDWHRVNRELDPAARKLREAIVTVNLLTMPTARPPADPAGLLAKTRGTLESALGQIEETLTWLTST